jgi:hypothetical protein
VCYRLPIFVFISYADGEEEPSFESSKKRDREIVACSGSGHHGNLSLLTHGLRGEVLTEFDIHGVEGMWSVNGQNEDEEGNTVTLSSFLFISLKDKTRILQTSEGRYIYICIYIYIC